MKSKYERQFIVLLVTILIYGIIIYNRVYNWNFELDYIYFKYLPYTIICILSVILIDRNILKNNVKFYNSGKGDSLYDIIVSFLILAIYYEIVIIYFYLFDFVFEIKSDYSAVYSMFRDMVSEPTKSIFYLGPYILITQGFISLMSIFYLQNFWSVSDKRRNHWMVLFSFAVFSSFLNIYYGYKGVLLYFLIHTIAFIAYYKYRRILPILIYYTLAEYLDIFGAIDYLSHH